MKRLKLVLISLFSFPQIAYAQSGAESIKGGESSLTFVVIAYMSLWVIFFGYLFFIAKKSANLKKEIDDLRGEIDKLVGVDDEQQV